MKKHLKTMKTRFLLLTGIMLILFALLLGSLITIQANESEKYRNIAYNQQSAEITLYSLRGSIFDRNANLLAFSVNQPSIAVNPKQIKNPEQTALYLSMALNKDKSEILSLLSYPSTFVWIERKVDKKAAEQLSKLNLEGVLILNEESGKRFYPKGNIASHVIGFTGIDDQGVEGIEAYYGDQHSDESIMPLRGKQGILKAELDRDGRILPGGFIEFDPPTPGKDIYLTIDESVQYIVQKELQKTVEKYNAAGGTVIVSCPKTGDILAMATYPDYLPSEGADTPEEIRRIRAVSDNYEPGSTFKVLMAAAALDSGTITAKDQIPCARSVEVGGYSLRNATDNLISPTGSEDIGGILAHSFNTGSAVIGLRMGAETFYKYLDKFGFGKQTGIDLPGEAEGILAYYKDWKPINTATIAYGQGISVTPIQMVQAYSAIANGGIMMRPRLVRKIVEGGTKTTLIKPEIVETPISPKTAHELMNALHLACVEGSGKSANIEGYKVGGKTGTASVVENGVYVPNKYIASFVGVAPVDDPKIVMLIMINEPKGVIWGGTVAAPLFNHIGSQILWRLGAIPQQSPSLQEINNPKETEDEEEN